MSCCLVRLHVSPTTVSPTTVNTDLQPTLHHDNIAPPVQDALAERSLQHLFHRTHEPELHLRPHLERHVVLDVLAVRPGEDDAGDIRAVCAEDFLFDPSYGADATSKGNLERL